MTFYPLDTTTEVDYVKSRPALKGFSPDDANVVAREVGDGNLNFVFFVENADDPTNSLVAKQALPYLRVIGESWPLTQERVRYEAQALRKHNEVAPGLAPEVYDFNDEMSTLIMEHLREHEIMRKPLVARKRFPKFADHISTFLANTLFFTSYTTHAEALIHADLHTGSIMLNEEDTRVIDPEFAFFGPMGYDIGAVLQNLILNHLSHYGHTPDKAERESYQAYILETVRDTWNGFAAKFDALWKENNQGEAVPAKYWAFPGGEEAFAEYRQRYILRLLRDTALHGGTKFLRRTMGIVSVWDTSSIEDPEKRAVAERAAIRIGSRWVLEKDSFNSIDDLVAVVLEETKGIVI